VSALVSSSIERRNREKIGMFFFAGEEDLAFEDKRSTDKMYHYCNIGKQDQRHGLRQARSTSRSPKAHLSRQTVSFSFFGTSYGLPVPLRAGLTNIVAFST